MGRKLFTQSQLEDARRLLSQQAVTSSEACSRLFKQGYELDRQGHHEEADFVYQQAIEQVEKLKAQPSSALTDSSLMAIAYNHGRALMRLNKYRAAIAALRRAIEILDDKLGSGTNCVLLERRGIILGWLAIAQRKAGMFRQAAQTYAEAISLWQRLPEMINSPVSPYTGFLGSAMLGLAKTLRQLGQDSAADDYLHRARELLESELALREKLN